VSVQSVEPRCYLFGRQRIDDDRHSGRPHDDDALRAGNHHRPYRLQCRLYSDDRKLCQRRAVTVKLAFLSPVAAGDQFQLLPGCNRTLATCTNVFNNAVHFGGFPYIPTPETAV
jgi:hypothetical protein